jgi:hypothetical protein
LLKLREMAVSGQQVVYAGAGHGEWAFYRASWCVGRGNPDVMGRDGHQVG